MSFIAEAEEAVSEIERDAGDSLIKWTQALDFDVYFADWKHLATSTPIRHPSFQKSSDKIKMLGV